MEKESSLLDEFRQESAVSKAIQNNFCVAGEGYYLFEHKKTKVIHGVDLIHCHYSGLAMMIVSGVFGGTDSIEHDIIVGRNLSEEQDNYLKGIINILN